MKILLIALEGINLSAGYVVREMSIYFPDDMESRHYFFAPPNTLELTPADRQTDRYTRMQLGGLGLFTSISGCLQADALVPILEGIATYDVHCAGHVAQKFLSAVLPNTKVVDIQSTTDFTFAKELPSAWCGVHHRPRYCSLAKLWSIKAFMEFNSLI